MSSATTIGLSPSKIHRRRWKATHCQVCRMRGCQNNYDAFGVNIPHPDCEARPKYDLARALAKSA